jgi:hypothetical protein
MSAQAVQASRIHPRAVDYKGRGVTHYHDVARILSESQSQGEIE